MTFGNSFDCFIEDSFHTCSGSSTNCSNLLLSGDITIEDVFLLLYDTMQRYSGSVGEASQAALANAGNS